MQVSTCTTYGNLAECHYLLGSFPLKHLFRNLNNVQCVWRGPQPSGRLRHCDFAALAFFRLALPHQKFRETRYLSALFISCLLFPLDSLRLLWLRIKGLTTHTRNVFANLCHVKSVQQALHARANTESVFKYTSFF